MAQRVEAGRTRRLLVSPAVTLSNSEIVRFVGALGLLLALAHLFGYLFKRLRQPRVIGEIVGGLVLGPTVLGTFLPGLTEWAFPDTGPVAAVLGAVYQLGLLFLMFS